VLVRGAILEWGKCYMAVIVKPRKFKYYGNLDQMRQARIYFLQILNENAISEFKKELSKQKWQYQ